MKRRTLKDQKWDFNHGKWEPVLLEEHVLRELVARLWWSKIKVYRINCPVGGKVRPNEPGLPDLMGVTPGGKAVFLEVKRPGGVHRPAQELFIHETKSYGAISGFVDSWESCRLLFAGYGIELPA